MVRDFFVDSFGGLWGPGRNCGLGGAAIGCQAGNIVWCSISSSGGSSRRGIEEENIVTGQNSVARHN